MLKGLSPILSPDLLWTLRAMGHGDEITIVDANYPATSAGPELIRIDAATAPQVLEAILSLLPLDQYDDVAAISMQVVGDPDKREPIVDEFEAIVRKHEPEHRVHSLERFTFYERANAGYAIVQTGETRQYGNLILKKGIVRPS
ncbi:RbsD/FucU family protein [Kaistia nematophila]|uniref:Ribose ABC transporter n=1 Tax=Kaistia nematophila TaxID=2994654 RepID=A0A9X3EBL2_9HYPH|nr:RbsD/FucU domain-containing protein [Kaistia nematophila]MCX5569830.1 ribose ABC transporter [Kaistia nematophila]